VKSLGYCEIGGAEKKILRGDMVGGGVGGWDPRYVVKAME